MMNHNNRQQDGNSYPNTGFLLPDWKSCNYNDQQRPYPPQRCETSYYSEVRGRDNYLRQTSHPQNYGQAPFNAMHHQHNRQRHYQKGKRAHEKSPTASTQFSAIRYLGESPISKRLLQKQNSEESQRQQHPTSSAQGPSQQNNKKPESKLKIEQNLKEQQWNDLFTQTLKKIENCTPGEEVNILLANLQPSRASWSKAKEQIYSDLMKLTAALTGVEKILVFGSTLTGLDFVGSDLDYHVQLKNPPSNSEEVKEVINKVAKLTRQYQNQFRVTYTILHARVPIIRLVHQRTRTTCDVNFTSRFGYYNSRFVGSILSYDSRIKGLAVILKLWSKSQKIAEKMIMSNYCLVALMIFYLQNLQEPMLDSIKNNQASHNPIVLDDKYKWNVFFNDKINLAQRNHLSLRQLLIGFFEFYDKINFPKYVVSIYNGDLVRRDVYDEHPDFEDYRRIVQSNLPPLRFDNPDHFVVQDGFELNINIGIRSKKNAAAFFDTIKASYNKCHQLKERPFSELLTKLFADIEMPKSSLPKKARKKFMMTVHSVAADLKLCQDILSAEDGDKVHSVDDQQKFFYIHGVEGTKKFLREIYLCTIVPDNDQSNSDAMTDRFKVILLVDTVNGRKKVNFKDQLSVAAEINLSEKMSEKKLPLNLNLTMTISSKNKGKSIDFELVDNEMHQKSALLNFSNFFSVNIVLALKFYLKERLEETRKKKELINLLKE